MRATEQFPALLASIGANVRRERERLGLTQGQVARSAELDLRFLQRVERGQTNLSLLALVAIAEVLEVPPTSLFREAKLAPPRRGRPPVKRKRR